MSNTISTTSSASSSIHLQHWEEAAWDAFVQGHPAAHLLQSSGWGALKVRFGWDAERIALAQPNGRSVAAGALVLFRQTYGLTMGYVPKGPLVDWSNRAEVEQVLAALHDACQRRGAAVLKLEPDLPDTAESRSLLYSYGFRPSTQTIQPRSTIIVDLCGDEDAILQRMKSKWRYNVRLAQRKGVTVRECTAADLGAFNELMAATAQRDGFSVHSADYYRAAHALFTPARGVFLLAEFEGQPLGAIVVTLVGATACYLWGASSDRERNRMPNHALQWAGMQWARARGATRYDLWGIPDEIGALAQGLRNGDGSGTPSDDLPIDVEQLPGHGLWGVYRFKQGFGGAVVRTVGAWDRPVSRLGFNLYQLGLTAQAARRTVCAAVAKVMQPPALVSVTSPADWRKTLAALPDPHVLQSWEWGEVKAQTEWTAERLVLDNGQAAFQFLWRQPLPGLPLRIGYLPKGPLVDWRDERAVTAVLDAIEQHARRRGCIVVKIDPDVAEESASGQQLVARLRRRGWVYSNEQIQFKNTATSKLAVGESALLEQMKSKWRYNVRLAERRGIQVRQATAADIPAFYALYAETGQRDGFLIRPLDYYRTTWQTFLDAQAVVDNPAGGALLLAEHPEEDAPLAGLFLMRYGQTAWYFYGASSERRRRDMPNYLLQWEAMRWALAQGCTVYDWWGAPTRLDDEEDAMQGVWQFKQGFGAEFQAHIGAWDYPVWPPLYRLYTQTLPLVTSAMRRLSRR